jgi:hypothetical protein
MNHAARLVAEQEHGEVCFLAETRVCRGRRIDSGTTADAPLPLSVLVSCRDSSVIELENQIIWHLVVLFARCPSEFHQIDFNGNHFSVPGN